MSRASLKDRLNDLNSLLEEQEKEGEIQLGIVSGVATASPEVVAFLTNNDVFADAVDQAHDKAGDGDWTVIGLDLPMDMAEDLVGRMQAALKATRPQRDEDKKYRWSVRTTPGQGVGKRRIQLRANLWTQEQVDEESQRIASTRSARRHPRGGGRTRTSTRQSA